MRVWLENVHSKNVVYKMHHQIHKNMDLSRSPVMRVVVLPSVLCIVVA